MRPSYPLCSPPALPLAMQALFSPNLKQNVQIELFGSITPAACAFWFVSLPISHNDVKNQEPKMKWALTTLHWVMSTVPFNAHNTPLRLSFYPHVTNGKVGIKRSYLTLSIAGRDQSLGWNPKMSDSQSHALSLKIIGESMASQQMSSLCLLLLFSIKGHKVLTCGWALGYWNKLA